MTHCLRFCLLLPLFCILSACSSSEVQDLPLTNRLMSIADKFYAVKALSPEKAIVIGYGGKILMTIDGGKTWQLKTSGTDLALYSLAFVDAQNGWISGQGGLILHTTDGGETWQKQTSGTDLPIFALSFIDQNTGWASGHQATYLRTTSGGESWEVGQVSASLEGVSEDAMLA
ncbi:MAG: WD40/YVTN/BNR-like repeat-containing protein, partial [Candidatus Binatia bacterium]